MAKYDFDWREFNESEYAIYCRKAKVDGFVGIGEYIASVRVGDLCFDFCAVRSKENAPPIWTLGYKVFVGGIDGYGCSDIDNGYPYMYAEYREVRGLREDAKYEDFKRIVESELIRCITTSSVRDLFHYSDKATAPLHVW